MIFPLSKWKRRASQPCRKKWSERVRWFGPMPDHLKSLKKRLALTDHKVKRCLSGDKTSCVQRKSCGQIDKICTRAVLPSAPYE